MNFNSKIKGIRLKGVSLSKTAITVIIIVVFVIDLRNAKKAEERLMRVCDIQQYYTYLPATLIHKDLSLSFVNENKEKLNKYVWGIPSPTGKPLIITSCGLTLLYSPTFLISHLVAKMVGYDTDGYSLPYYIGLQFNLIIYLLIGLIFLRKVLLRFFSESVTAITLLVLFFGTNLYYYSTYESPMPHAYEFSLAAVFMYYTIRWHESPNFKNTILTGLLLGIITLIRPTNIVVLLFFMLWGVTTLKDAGKRIKIFIQKWYLVLIMVFIFLLIWSPQFLYWKYISGHYLFYSYDTTSHFDFLSPHIIKGLFSYRKGWLLYTPVMAFSLAGILLLIRKYKGLAIPVGVYTLVNIYIVLSWFCWWYGGSFGLRAFIDSYAVLSLPLGTFLAWTLKQRAAIRYGFLAVFSLLVVLNLFQTSQYRNGAIHYANMTKKAYWETFGKLKPTGDFFQYLKNPLEEP
jgi:hypothetical protein